VLGWPVLASYGMTEACSQIATQALGCLDSAYRPAPIPLLPIWRAETEPDGRLRIAGPALFSGSLAWNGSGWIYQPRIGEWFVTRDRVGLGADGLTPLGRADAMVKVLGELVDPGSIERELSGLAGGWLRPDGFVVLAIPEARTGHALVPVFDASTDAVAIATLLADYQQRVPGYLRLREPVLLDGFPRSPLGKPRRAEILRRIAGDPSG
jgi:O-succinylbenzoic acid--CoA ligase